MYGVKDCYGQGPKRYFLYRASTIIGWYDDIEPAKAAAQTDHEARIRSALHPTPAPKGMETAVEIVARRMALIAGHTTASLDENIGGVEQNSESPVWAHYIPAARSALTAAYPHMTGAEAREAHPLARFGSEQIAGLGLYRVHWKSGGSSLAAIGMMENGDRWIAPTNWVRPGLIPSAGEWGEIERLEPIHPTDATPQPAHSITTPWGWVCSGEGDGWKETDKLVRDPELVARYRGDPNWHTIVPLYPQPAPSGVNAEMLAALDDFIQGGENCSGPVNGIHLKHLREWRRAIAAAEAQPAAVGWQDAWQELIEYDDRTSPEEYPDMALISREELADFMQRAVQNPADHVELEAYREAAEYDPMMSGPVFRAWNRSQLDRARKLTEAIAATPQPAPSGADAGMLAALKEAQYFIQAPAEDLKDGVMSRIRSAIASFQERKEVVADALMERVWEAYWDGPGNTKDALERVVELVLASAAEATRTKGVEVGAIRICPMRDGPCPHGYGCPHVGDGPYGYPCKEGWLPAAPKQGGE